MYHGLLVSLAAFIVLVRGDINLIVKTHSGTIKGTRNVGIDRMFNVFYSIPYAEPPVGELRFQAPVPVKSWSGIRDATQPPPVCMQPQKFTEINGPTLGQEDCLYLNVYVPNILVRMGKKTPVIVYIHGGGFQTGSGNKHRGDYFMDKNVILVTMNYRLGVLGFLGMNNDVISGNFGMKDQALALKWIKDNIEAFGGDPDNITLMGQSAGSAAVHAHMFSPLSKGLFHKAIMQSGSILSPWAFYDEAYTEASSIAFLFTTGCFYKDHVKALKCLQRLPADDLIKTEGKLYVWDVDPTVLFKLTIETNVTNQPFLPQKPSKETYVTKNIPCIIGMNSGEGGFKVIRYLLNGGSIARIINMNKKRLLPLLNQYLFTTEPELIDNITQKIENYYFNNDEIGPNTGLKIVNMLTDSLMTHPMIRTILTYPDGARYAYYFDHRGSYSSVGESGLTMDLGVCHSDEMPLIFRDEEKEKKWTSQDKLVSTKLLQYWTNFATYSDPNGHFTDKVWKPVETDGIEFLHFKNDSTMAMEKNFILKSRYDFWYSLPIGRQFL
ncbi:acetylcholinesterase-like [Planococcus citri]|uniref:acetylcholinesterase-like n=1 Tax=Planococcus citri TaxID=170843 RepID=UPI0031FA30C8